jgi:hypothetical protein
VWRLKSREFGRISFKRLKVFNAFKEPLCRAISVPIAALLFYGENREVSSPSPSRATAPVIALPCWLARLHRYRRPLRHPSAPGLSLTGVGLIIPDHASGLPVLRRFAKASAIRYPP